MAMYTEMTKEQLQSEHDLLKREFDEICAKGKKLDMSRGKMDSVQLDLSSPMLWCLSEKDEWVSNGMDCRNYGGLDGIIEMKQIVADILGLEPPEVIVGGNSSLEMMFDNVGVNMSHGVRGGVPWQKQGEIKFICPVPGYDRHFRICEYFHIKMIPVEMLPTGPDMDVVEKLVKDDPMIKGIWCVPLFSNPSGCVYSDETVKRLANLTPAADDFRIYWDHAYCIHNFRGELPVIPNIIRECEKAGSPNMPLVFMSFSKISFCGAAVAGMASSKSNCEYVKERMFVQTVGPNKMNQLRHARFFEDLNGVLAHMKKMAEILRPKFEHVVGKLESNLGGKGIAEWNDPDGGYFISFNTLDNLAKRTVALCAEAGLTMTEAGATFPYGIDPRDRNIRIAPSYPSFDELKEAIEVFCVAVRLAAVEKLLGA